MKGGVNEQVHVIQDEGAIDVDVDAASAALMPSSLSQRSKANTRFGPATPSRRCTVTQSAYMPGQIDADQGSGAQATSLFTTVVLAD
jgi:hypothetical protein